MFGRNRLNRPAMEHTKERCDMKRRHLAWPVAVLGALSAVFFGSASLAGQGTGKAPLTPWGDPDLQGLWTNATVTPFERPTQLAGKEVLTEQEAAQFEQQTAQATNADR